MKTKYANLGLLPAAAILATVGLAPLVVTCVAGFHKLNLKTPWMNRAFAGFDNYVRLALDGEFWRCTLHTAVFVTVTLALEIVAGFWIAYALYRSGLGRRFWCQIALFLPLATPSILSGQMWRIFFHDADGIANLGLLRLGFVSGPVPWLSDPGLAWLAIGIAEVWKIIPFVTVLFLAALVRIPREIWEAAQLDGVRWSSGARHIALPLVRPTLVVIMLFRILDGIRVFDVIYILTQGGPGGATDVLGLYVYRTQFSDLDIGLGCAASVAMLLMAGAAALAVWTIGSTREQQKGTAGNG